jgi:hypothetical protein
LHVAETRYNGARKIRAGNNLSPAQLAAIPATQIKVATAVSIRAARTGATGHTGVSTPPTKSFVQAPASGASFSWFDCLNDYTQPRSIPALASDSLVVNALNHS